MYQDRTPTPPLKARARGFPLAFLWNIYLYYIKKINGLLFFFGLEAINMIPPIDYHRQSQIYYVVHAGAYALRKI